MTNKVLIPGKKYMLLLSSISYLNEKKVKFGSVVTYMKEDWGHWFRLRSGEQAMIADPHWFADVTPENKMIIHEIDMLEKQKNALNKRIAKLHSEFKCY